MKKKLVIVNFLLILLFSIFSSNLKAVSGDSIKEINILVNILENGDAKITEEWKVYNGGDGTEWYKPIDNLNHMELEDFKVWFNNWEGFNVYDDWIVQDSFNNKMNKFGIHRTGGNSFELCWGKTKKNTDITYKLEYIYTNFVQKFPDGNGFNVKFINDDMNPAPEKVRLAIKPYKGKFSDKNSEIWSFGTNRGELKFEEGKIIFSGKNFKRMNYLTLLVKSNSETLPASYEGKGTFEDLKNKALEGSDFGKLSAFKERVMIVLGYYDGIPILFPILLCFFIMLILFLQGFKGWFKVLVAFILFGLPFIKEINILYIALPFLNFVLLPLLPIKYRVNLPKEMAHYKDYNRESILKYSFKDMYNLGND